MRTSPLSSRTFNTYPLSIGTSFAIEAFSIGELKPYDEQKLQTLPLDPNDYEEVWINLITLIRNMMGSLSAIELAGVTEEDIAYELGSEIELIREIIQSAGNHLRVKFYTNSYKGLAKVYPYAMLKQSKTVKQKEYLAFVGACVSEFYKKHKLTENMMHFDLHLKPIKRPKAVMLTHYAHDLTCSDKFDGLDLIESHTGALKSKSLWWTKFSDNRTNRIPMNSLFLQIFGDSTLFGAHVAKLRDGVLALAEEHEWNYATTKERINLTLNYMKDPYAREVMRKMV